MLDILYINLHLIFMAHHSPINQKDCPHPMDFTYLQKAPDKTIIDTYWISFNNDKTFLLFFVLPIDWISEIREVFQGHTFFLTSLK